MTTLEKDIKQHADWIVKAFAADKLKLNYTIESFKTLDNFFEQHAENGAANPNGRLAANTGSILFSIGAYMGESFIQTLPGTVWLIDEKDTQAEINATLKLPNGELIQPMQRAIKRFQNGAEDSIYAYGAVILQSPGLVVANKKWWKFW